MYYTDSHEWVKIENGIGVVGISEFARRELGEVVYVELPQKGMTVTAKQEIAVLESTKAAADIYSPVSGVIVEINLYGQSTRGRLNWISPNSSNLILTMNGQPAPSIVSVRMFRRMLKNERARFVEVAPLFERAVQSLLESADQLDMADAA